MGLKCSSELEAGGTLRNDIMEDLSNMKAGKTAIVLAAGQGKRMNSEVQKQYLVLNGKPLIYYALKAFEESEIDRVVLVVGSGEVEYCRREIVEKFCFKKTVSVVEGGKERYHSVYEGLKAAGDCDIVLIHDGARPLIDREMIHNAIDGAAVYGACVLAMPVKETIKSADSEEFAAETPDRSRLWGIQTPQAFDYQLILHAYEALFAHPECQHGITDDAMVVETMTDRRVKLIRGSYSNIKVTTPEDMVIAQVLLENR